MVSKKSRQEVRVKKHMKLRNRLNGTAECPRLVVFRSNKNIEAQIIDDVKGVTLASASSVALKLENGSNIEAAKKVGAAVAEAAKAKNISEVVFDRGGYVYHGRVAALADAAREGGLKF